MPVPQRNPPTAVGAAGLEVPLRPVPRRQPHFAPGIPALIHSVLGVPSGGVTHSAA